MTFKNKIFVYAAGGYYYPGKDIQMLQDEMKSYMDLGFTTVKMKIGGASLSDDLKRIESSCHSMHAICPRPLKNRINR